MEFAEEMQQDISEAIYARVDTDSAAAIADDFCPKAVAPEVGDLATARVLRLHSMPSFSVLMRPASMLTPRSPVVHTIHPLVALLLCVYRYAAHPVSTRLACAHRRFIHTASFDNFS
jgi:hypothetical protein